MTFHPHAVIVNGPSKFDLMVSLFEGSPSPRTTVRFELQSVMPPPDLMGPGYEIYKLTNMEVAITSVAQDGGSGECWHIEGHDTEANRRVKGTYSSQRRHGIIHYLK